MKYTEHVQCGQCVQYVKCIQCDQCVQYIEFIQQGRCVQYVQHVRCIQGVQTDWSLGMWLGKIYHEVPPSWQNLIYGGDPKVQG